MKAHRRKRCARCWRLAGEMLKLAPRLARLERRRRRRGASHRRTPPAAAALAWCLVAAHDAPGSQGRHAQQSTASSRGGAPRLSSPASAFRPDPRARRRYCPLALLAVPLPLRRLRCPIPASALHLHALTLLRPSSPSCARTPQSSQRSTARLHAATPAPDLPERSRQTLAACSWLSSAGGRPPFSWRSTSPDPLHRSATRPSSPPRAAPSFATTSSRSLYDPSRPTSPSAPSAPPLHSAPPRERPRAARTTCASPWHGLRA